ncbi:hypothetical protein M5K25_004075 [Dendrobium thyrsiflorum]|uniref:U-box domain-containing protein n=1 Tax=Dendrobium thyrsiflorum TaxID=117978 RepID=A0ABD0VTE6_DENTH
MALRALKATAMFPFRRRPKPSLSSLSIPSHFICPISLDLMQDPVTLPSGITYDRRTIELWLSSGHRTCPVTLLSVELDDQLLIPNHSIRRMIQDWCVANRSHGVERIPTPKTPITSLQVSDTLAEISAACRSSDRLLCAELIALLKKSAEESERNLRCILSNGATPVLAAAFLRFKTENFLSAFAGISNLDDKETILQLTSDESLKSIILILSKGSLSGKLNAILVLKELLVAVHETEQAIRVARTEQLVEKVVMLIKNPISLESTKASLVAAYYLSFTQATKLAETGLVPILLEILVDAEKSLSEKALAALDGVLEEEKGRESAAEHALAMPVLVKKVFRVSDLATELAVSGMWKVCRKWGEGEEGRWEKCAVEALKVGAFQKLLLLLQMGCSDRAKDRASELLRILNGLEGKEECVETLDFRGVKRAL